MERGRIAAGLPAGGGRSSALRHETLLARNRNRRTVLRTRPRSQVPTMERERIAAGLPAGGGRSSAPADARRRRGAQASGYELLEI